MLHQIFRTTTVRAPVEDVWQFIATPVNLNRMTPPEMNFEILSDPPETMYAGLLIEYNVKIPMFGRWRWLTEIKHIRAGHSFVDEQRLGPYQLWYHYHEVRPAGRQTKMIDRVTYQMPYWWAGEVVHALIVKRQLNAIFAYREKAFRQIFA